MSGDMKQTIIPKSDQLNADDLITGPMTIKITGVTIRGGQEQPVSIHFDGDEGKPYKACKSMCRVMVAAWGPDSKQYVGRSMTLYRDPKVKWAGMEVGGIRISHMSDIGDDLTMALTVTRANRKPYTVRPLVEQATGKKTASPPAHPQPSTSPSPADPEAGAALINPDQLIDLEDRLKVAKLDKADLFAAIKKSEGLIVPSLAKLPANWYERARGWIERNAK